MKLLRLEGPGATALLGGLVALKVAVLFILAWNMRFVMDEFVQFGWAKYLSNGLFETIWPGKAVGYAIFYKLAHVIGWDAQSFLLAGRMQTGLLGCATVGIVYACARNLEASRGRALLVILVLLSFSNFIERIFRTIAEPPALFFATAALLAVLRRGPGRGAILVAGLLSGLAFLTTQKSLYFNVALGLALVGDAAVRGRFLDGIVRGALLVLGWAVPIVAYCLFFGGGDPLRIAVHLFFGPAPVLSPQVSAEYGGLRGYVLQTLLRNFLLYAFCFAGMILALLRIRTLDERTRVAFIFSLVITAFIFSHDQPWPYVFIMALPFISLWVAEPFDALAGKPVFRNAAAIVLAVAVAASFGRNLTASRIDNHAQLALVGRAERLVAPEETYFDAVGMLPNRKEPTTLWLDRHTILQMLREGRRSELYRIFDQSPPKAVIWSYRLDAAEPLIAPFLRNSYVRIAPNIRSVGRVLKAGEATRFDVSHPGAYALYGARGEPLAGIVEVDGQMARAPIRLEAGTRTVVLRSGPSAALLLPRQPYSGLIEPGSDDDRLFDRVYD